MERDELAGMNAPAGGKEGSHTSSASHLASLSALSQGRWLCKGATAEPSLKVGTTRRPVACTKKLHILAIQTIKRYL
jgi:hypothetical protein